MCIISAFANCVGVGHDFLESRIFWQESVVYKLQNVPAFLSQSHRGFKNMFAPIGKKSGDILDSMNICTR